jgi:protein gp37
MTRERVDKLLAVKAEREGVKRSVFACGYSDFFIADADGWRDEAWELIRQTPNLNYQISTKRTRRILDHLPKDWGDGYKNVWLGTAVELKKRLDRLDDLRKIPCVLRYVDLAPMLEDLMPELAEHIDGFGWVLASGETGCGYVDPRPYDEQWARNVRDFCVSKGIPFFYSHTAGRRRYPPRLLDGREWNEVPTIYYNGL